jgi:AraC family transcriptional regulator
LYVERYLFKTVERSVSGVNGIALVTMFGGSRVQEGDTGQWRSSVLPSQTLLVPSQCPTHWKYSGTVDFAVFYFPDRMEGIQDRLRLLTESRREPLLISDALVSASALQLVNELHKGVGADERFMAMLASVMLEQAYRVLTTPETGGINPRHIHFVRLQAVLGYIHEHLAEELSAQLLADKAQVSLAHFRRLFEEAMGAPPHRYVLAARLEQARKLLTMTTLPISRIAEDCGFSSQSHLTERFRTVHAATPAEYRTHVLRAKAKHSAQLH